MMNSDDPGSGQCQKQRCSVRISSENKCWEGPIHKSVLQSADVNKIDKQIIQNAIEKGVFPSLSKTIKASEQKATLYDVARWYLVGRKYGLNPQRSKEEAFERVVIDRDSSSEQIYTYFQRLDHPDDQNPTEWFDSKLESLWKWYYKTQDLDVGLLFRDHCIDLRQTLIDIQGVPTPELSVEDFTPEDFVKAGDEQLLDDMGVDPPDMSKALSGQKVEFNEERSYLILDITEYSVSFAETWQAILDAVDQNLKRTGMGNNAVSLLNEKNCTQTSAHEVGRRIGEHYDVRFSAFYAGGGTLSISAKITPRGGVETDQVQFKAAGTNYSTGAIDLFIAEGIRRSEGLGEW